MYKKILVVAIVVIAIVLIGIYIYSITSNNNKEQVSNDIFGNELCDSVLHMATFDLAEHTCKICSEKFKASSMREDICDTCAKETNRCEFCGKKLSEEIKIQRQETLNNMEEE